MTDPREQSGKSSRIGGFGVRTEAHEHTIKQVLVDRDLEDIRRMIVIVGQFFTTALAVIRNEVDVVRLLEWDVLAWIVRDADSPYLVLIVSCTQQYNVR
jgi:hypothetical protein